MKPYKDRMEILTDGARYLPDGTVVEITSKVRASAFAPLAITGSGSVAAIDRLAPQRQPAPLMPRWPFWRPRLQR